MARQKRNLDRADILDRLLDGTIVVDWENHVVYSTSSPHPKGNRARRHDYRIYYFGCRESHQYPFVRLRIKGVRSWVPCHHLVWMYHNKKVIPEGRQVDHIDGSIENWYPENLQVLSVFDHHRKTTDSRYGTDGTDASNDDASDFAAEFD